MFWNKFPLLNPLSPFLSCLCLMFWNKFPLLNPLVKLERHFFSCCHFRLCFVTVVLCSYLTFVLSHSLQTIYLTLCETTARSTKLRKMQSYKSVFYQKKNLFCLSQPYLVWKLLSHWPRKTNPKVRGTVKSLPNIISKRSHQEECAHTAKTAKSVAFER